MDDIQRIDQYIWRASITLEAGIPLNVYLLAGSGYALLIDSGTPEMLELLQETMRTANVKPENMRLILNTHPHPAHTGCNGFFRRQYGCLIAAHSIHSDWHRNREAQLRRLDSQFPQIVADHPEWRQEIFNQLGPPHSVDILIDEGVRFELGGPELETFRFSGHMEAELAWFDHHSKTFFFGDALTLIEAPFLHGHVTVSGYRQSLQRLEGLLVEQDTQRVLLSHHPPLTREEALQLIENISAYLDRLDTIILNLITGHGEINLRELWQAVCETLGRKKDYRSLATVYAHVQALLQEDKIEEIEPKVYSSTS